MKSLVVRSAVVASLGGLIFGFDTAVISGTTESLTKVFSLSDSSLGFTVAVALIGTIVGALITGNLADRFGRKPVLYAIGVLFILGALGTGLAADHTLFMIFRFLGGVGVGAASVCAPIYTAEVAPPSNRGRLVGLVQFNICLGILLAYLSNYVIAQTFPADVAWRWMFGVMAVPSVLYLVLLFTVPESPRWLMAQGRDDEARTISRRLTTSESESEHQLADIRQTLDAQAREEQVKFFAPAHRKVILLAFMIAMFNQLSGINAILYYAPEVMKKAGADDEAAMLMSIAVGVMNLVATMAALTVIDKFGRRKLMLIGSWGYLISLGFLTAIMFHYDPNFDSTSSMLVLTGLLVFIAAHALGQGAVIWVFISEIFPNRIRGRGQSLGSLTHWVFAAATSWAFPPIIGALGSAAAFAIFFVCMIGQLVWVLKVMPETKGRKLEEMETSLAH